MPIVTPDSNVTLGLLAIAANASYSNYPTLPAGLYLADYRPLLDDENKPIKGGVTTIFWSEFF